MFAGPVGSHGQFAMGIDRGFVIKKSPRSSRSAPLTVATHFRRARRYLSHPPDSTSNHRQCCSAGVLAVAGLAARRIHRVRLPASKFPSWFRACPEPSKGRGTRGGRAGNHLTTPSSERRGLGQRRPALLDCRFSRPFAAGRNHTSRPLLIGRGRGRRHAMTAEDLRHLRALGRAGAGGTDYFGSFAAEAFSAFGVRFKTSSCSTSASTFLLSTTTDTHLPSWNVVALA
jgi:hypothetical protein